jgi:BirA family biotin operon repressor/biotin-[acetyl-CoA-carboxylase] ligase
LKFDIRSLEKTTSTNDDAKRSAELGEGEGLVIWALQQSSGRGRHGRQWFSPLGNLYFSILLRPNVPSRDYGRYSFIAALAIYDAIHSMAPSASLELKWPNDVLVKGKKISGILLEAGEGWLIVGIGVNVLQTPESPLYPTTSFAQELVTPPLLKDVLNKILMFFGEWHNVLERRGFTPIRLAWLASARKGAMRVRLPQEVVEGEFADLDDQGNLRLLMSDGAVRCISTGDVFFE